MAEGLFQQLAGVCVFAGQQAHRPVRAEHQALGAEQFQGQFNKGAQGIGVALIGPGFSEQARQFAAYVGQGRQWRQVFSPTGRAVGDVRFAQVIKHQMMAVVTLAHRCSGVEVGAADQHLVDVALLLQVLQSTGEAGVSHEGCGPWFVLNLVAKALELWPAAPLFQVLFKRWLAQVDPTHHAEYPRVLLRHVQ